MRRWRRSIFLLILVTFYFMVLMSAKSTDNDNDNDDDEDNDGEKCPAVRKLGGSSSHPDFSTSTSNTFTNKKPENTAQNPEENSSSSDDDSEENTDPAPTDNDNDNGTDQEHVRSLRLMQIFLLGFSSLTILIIFAYIFYCAWVLRRLAMMPLAAK